MNKAPISSRSISFVSILVPWLRADKVGWKPEKNKPLFRYIFFKMMNSKDYFLKMYHFYIPVMVDEVEFTKRVFDPLGSSVLITVALGGGAGVVLVQVAGL